MTTVSEETKGASAVVFAVGAFAILGIILVLSYYTDSMEQTNDMIKSVGFAAGALHLGRMLLGYDPDSRKR